MDSNLVTAIVSASATALVAIVAILSSNTRLDETNAHLGRVETKLDIIGQMLAGCAMDVARIKEKLGIG